MGIRDELGQRILVCDGAMGTQLQSRGLPAGHLPELWNVEQPGVVVDIHCRYLQAGADIILSNSFGANSLKLGGSGFGVEQLVGAAMDNASAARNLARLNGRSAYIALDIGPLGQLLAPLGQLGFEQAYQAFAEIVTVGVNHGADLILIETMSDTRELKAAVLAAKDNGRGLPIFATVTLDSRGKLLTGGDIPAVVALLEGLGIDALGINCGLGPLQMEGFVRQLTAHSSLPLIVNPNAGLPRVEQGQTVYDIDAAQFAVATRCLAEAGAWVVGGCCGTGFEHIAALSEQVREVKPLPLAAKQATMVSSFAQAVVISHKQPIMIGERINPTGKARFKQALKEHDLDFILRQGLEQQEKGAAILDVNVGLPEIDEAALLSEVVEQLQAVCELPLQIDTADIAALERALRCYNGKALVNSVNGKVESMAAVFPLIKRYGGVVIGLTLDEQGIPATAQGRLDIARRIVQTAAAYGIDKKDIVIDPLCLTISAEQDSALVTLEALELISRELGVNTSLGVSNVSFGLPERERVNTAFFTMALQRGLSAAIVNPQSAAVRGAYYAYLALAGLDAQCQGYIAAMAEQPTGAAQPTEAQLSLRQAIEKGLRDQADSLTRALLQTTPPLEIIDSQLIPALNTVGNGFEQGTVFLPQLLISAESAKAAFAAVQEHMRASGQVQQPRGKVILATVAGDIHDIGKNIVKALLENYQFEVIDLGKDVPIEQVVAATLHHQAPLVGLSALMTTTVVSMEATIAALHKAAPSCRVMVGGAVLTQEYADAIGADRYAADAMAAVRYADEIFG